MNLKGIVVGLLTVALIFSSFTTNVLASNVECPQSKTFVQNQDLYTSDGKPLGRVHRTIIVNIQKVTGGVEAKVTEDNDYELELDFASIPEYQKTFSDGIKTKTYFITNDNKVYVNGKLLEGIDRVLDSLMQKRVKRDSGGIPSICHYYDDGKYENYAFGCYADMDFSLINGANPTGHNISKFIGSDNPFFDRAKNSVDSFQSNFNSLAIAFKTLTLTIAGAGLVAPTVVGLIALGGGIGGEVAVVVNYFDNANSDLKKAYGYIKAA